MCAGGVLAYLVLIPAIKFFGSGQSAPLAPGTVPISQMSPDAIRSAYILYIGAGAVAARPSLVRTERDLSMKVVAFGSLALIIAIMLAPPLHMNAVGAILIV